MPAHPDRIRRHYTPEDFEAWSRERASYVALKAMLMDNIRRINEEGDAAFNLLMFQWAATLWPTGESEA